MNTINHLFSTLCSISFLFILFFLAITLITRFLKFSAKAPLKLVKIFALIWLICFIIFGITIDRTTIALESIKLSIPDYQTEYDINTEIPIEVSVVPENADTKELQYIIENNNETNSKFSGSGFTTGTKEETYNIHIESGDIKSNTLSIKVVDITARQEAQKKAAREAEEKRLAEEKAAKEEEEKRLAEEKAAKEEEEKRLAEEKAAQEMANIQNENATPSSNQSDTLNTYDNAAQQNTTNNYVLNTSTYKFHYPGCYSVKKIAPQNYSTSNSSRDELIAQGYSPCGNCNP